MPLTITDTPMKLFEKCAHRTFHSDNKWKQIYINVLGQFDEVQQDDFSRELRSDYGRKRVIKIVFEHEMSEKIVTDQGTHFTSKMFKNSCKLLKIEKIQTTASSGKQWSIGTLTSNIRGVSQT